VLCQVACLVGVGGLRRPKLELRRKELTHLTALSIPGARGINGLSRPALNTSCLLWSSAETEGIATALRKPNVVRQWILEVPKAHGTPTLNEGADKLSTLIKQHVSRSLEVVRVHAMLTA
jgi:hypothetical protein